MKTKAFFFFASLLLVSLVAQAQRGIRVGYINMDYILENVPEYQEASSQLDSKVKKWKSEIEKKIGEIEEMKKQLQNERVLLTKELIEEREEEISYEEEEIFEYQQKRFGPEGDLAIQKRQLIEPIQDQVFNAVQEISKNKKYDVVLTKKEAGVLYVADRLDMSDQVLRSITRSAKRKQINSKKEEKSFDIDEAKTVEQDKATQARQKAIDDKKAEREALIEEKAKQRQEEKDARNAAFEERRQRILEERQKRKDSIAAVKATAREKSGRPAPLTAEEKKARQERILAERQKRKDSILQVRKARKDSITNARKNKANNLPKPPEEDDNGEGGI
ncbi:OmpH family outer membrane protein [uncultured Dokdonia sp.]|uniref:OmpH family outer membrane protein n=1 Tax=uncultured Dokdonia sp. TaxID=575653 RepID=UPI00262D87AF|nr:OmpH family outer membrane protein [uncultured Dokdonia sp.]